LAIHLKAQVKKCVGTDRVQNADKSLDSAALKLGSELSMFYYAHGVSLLI